MRKCAVKYIIATELCRCGSIAPTGTMARVRATKWSKDWRSCTARIQNMTFSPIKDDDMYIRTECMDQFVAGLNASDVFVLTSKPLSPLGKTFGKDHHECSTTTDYMYPRGQKVVYSKAALSHLVTGFTLGSVTTQCKEFDVTNDVGNPLIHWM